MILKDPHRRVLVALLDGEFHLGAEITPRGNDLSVLFLHQLICCAYESDGYLFDRWAITERGVAALEVAGD